MLQTQSGPLNLRSGESRRVSATGTDASGNPVAVPVTWSSDNTAIANVDSFGNVTATGTGATIVRASYKALSAEISVRVQYATMELLATIPADVEVGIDYDIRAIFRDVRGREFSPGVDTSIHWAVSTGVARLEFPKAQDRATVRVRTLAPGPVRIDVSASGVSASRSWTAFEPGDQLGATIERFVVRQGQAGIGWLYVPELFVRRRRTNVTVTRIEFRSVSWLKNVCGSAVLRSGEAEPLFDFQPYNFSWVADPVPHGTPLEVTVWLNVNGQATSISTTGRVESTWVNGQVIDYSTEGFPWYLC